MIRAVKKAFAFEHKGRTVHEHISVCDSFALTERYFPFSTKRDKSMKLRLLIAKILEM